MAIVPMVSQRKDSARASSVRTCLFPQAGVFCDTALRMFAIALVRLWDKYRLHWIAQRTIQEIDFYGALGYFYSKY